MNPSALPLSARRLLVIGLALFGVLSGAQTAARAQGVVQVNCTMATKQAFDAGDQSAIQSLVGSAAGELASEDPAVSQRGRDRLLAPLQCPGVSVAFRLEYGKAVEPAMAPLVNADSDRVAVNALRVLGELRTSGSIRLLGQALQSNRSVVRFGAASGFRTLLASPDAGFPEREIDRALGSLRDALTAERDPLVADAVVVALASTGASPDARTRAMRMASEAVALRLKDMRTQHVNAATEAWARIAYRAVFTAQQTLIDDLGRGKTDQDFAKASSLLGGQTLAFARRIATQAGSGIDPVLRQDLAGAVGSAEALLIFSHNALAQNRVPPADLKGLFEVGTGDGNLQPFDNAVAAWIGPSGRLTKAPYGANAADFN